MDHGPLTEQIVEAFDTMSVQLQAGARYVLDRPRDVALLSMREQARQAGVQPATMTRLAKHLGMDGYDDVRELYAAAVRDGDLGFAGKAGVQVVSQKLKGDKALVAARIAARKHRYMPASLLDSQFATLEPPQAAIAVDVSDCGRVTASHGISTMCSRSLASSPSTSTASQRPGPMPWREPPAGMFFWSQACSRIHV